MVVAHERCQICGEISDFLMNDDEVLLREAKCNHCGASLRNSDVAGQIIRYVSGKQVGLINQQEQLGKYKILNVCSSGYIHNALKKLDSYICSEFFDDVPSGEYYEGILCVDLCNMPFSDGSYDIIVTEDVFEHIEGYEKAMTEIYRVLKPGGCHIFTVPIHEGHKTVSREGKKEVYHGDPIHADSGSLVITDWGDDIKDIVEKYGYHVDVVKKHKFYDANEITVVDKSYDEYLAKRDNLNSYLKYNSIVIMAYKDMSAISIAKNKIVYSLEQLEDILWSKEKNIVSLNRAIREKNDIIRELNDDNERRGNHILSLDQQIREKNTLIQGLQEGNEERNCHVKKLDDELAKSENLIQKLQMENEERNRHIEDLDRELSRGENIIQELQRENEDRNGHIQYLDSIIMKNNHMMQDYRTEVETKNRQIEIQKQLNDAQLQQIVKQSEQIIHQTEQMLKQSQDVDRYVQQNIKKSEQIQRQNEENTEQKKILQQQDKDILEFKQRIAELEQTSQSEKNKYEQKIAELEQTSQSERNEYEQKIAELEQTSQSEKSDYEQRIAEMEQTIKNKEGHIELLLEVERTYEREKKTHSYKAAKKIQKIGDFLLPPNSKRRFFLRIIFNIFRHPFLMLHVISIKRIKNYIKYMKLEGMEGVKRRYEEAVDIERMQIYPADKIDLDLEGACSEEYADKQNIEDYERLEFSLCDSPCVSIIIPVYNEFHYTYNCLKSILKNSGDISYEIIIADDCSTDLTKDIERIVDNINVITTRKNERFLLNCNNAAKYAKGRYILFLNNDTQVQDNWLEPLVNLIESNDKIGMVGSKLVYPDGRLQEAGGILWKDGSAWNYGNGKNPEDPEFNYIKEVDYISGAAIMIRRKLWNKIGGFDTRFAPAYYEDTDLAFEVRKHGYKVMYQPLSVVVHFEGVSNGTDVESGQKQYQQVNCKKFYNKWINVLQNEHEDNGVNVFIAKDKSINKKHILVVDHYVPHHDQDAGGKCTYMYLKLFVKMGFQVTFIGDNFFKHEPYTTELNQMGIEVLYGNYYYNNWQNWLKENSHYFDYVYLQRPHIAVKYIDLVKQYSNAKILYFAHDLHHIREYREYEMTKDPKLLASSEKWKKIEYDLFDKTDVGHVVGSYEQEIMQTAFPNKPIRNIPLYIYDKILADINKDFSKRQDLLYVGGFGHPPNIDAVLWFAKEVFPIIVYRYPNIKWHIVGGKVTKEIEKLASTNIIIEGFVSDECLEILYRICRMAVVPLRFGAGVKGKVVEAGYYQIPLVTTSIGAEGLNIEDGSMLVEDDANKMANIICDLYEDYNRLAEMSDNGKEFIRKNFLLSEAERVIRLDMDT